MKQHPTRQRQSGQQYFFSFLFQLPVVQSLIVHVLGMIGCKYFTNAVEMGGRTFGKKNARGFLFGCYGAHLGHSRVQGAKLAPGFGVLEYLK